MSITPEGLVKRLVRDLLAAYNIQPASKAGTFDSAAGWYFMPVQSAYAVKGVPDFLGHYLGVFFGIETKAPGKKATGYQALQISAIRASGGAVFVVDSPETLKVFQQWLEDIKLYGRS